MKYSIFFIGFCLINAFSFAQSIDNKLTIPRDTSFTVYLAFQKITKNFPEATPALIALPKGVVEFRDLVYATLSETPFGKRELHIDLFRPEKQGKYPALIMVHGGGWSSGNKSMEIPLAQQIATRGYVTVAVEYQLSLEAKWPAAVHNIKAAIRWLRANANKYCIDTARIAISGGSAGGQLATLIGMTNGVQQFEGNMGNNEFSSSVQAVINLDGVVDFLAPASLNKERKPNSPDVAMLGGTFLEKPMIWKEASPIFWVKETSPPVLFLNSGFSRFHAGQDEMLGIMKELHIYSEVHGFDVKVHPFWLFHPWFETTVDYMTHFMDKILKIK
jgi:acetyl esterase/lipase